MNTNPLNTRVFYSASILIAILLLTTFLLPHQIDVLFDHIQKTIVDNGSWFFVFVVASILTLMLYLGFSRYGDVKLGPDHAQPEYSLLSWLSMLFAAGMGIGLMFFGVSEPVMHYLTPPSADSASIAAVQEAMRTTFFHWGLHAWAIYGVVALILAYFSFRQKLPLTLRSALYPFIGDRIYGWIGDLIDTFAVIGTVFGVATSLGFGVLQINSGLNYLLGLEVATSYQVILIIAITLLASFSVMSGLNKGIRWLSQLNMLLALGLLLLILIIGPTVFLLKAFLQNTGAYLSDLIRNTFNLYTYQKTDWIGGWTIFYWGWWLAWAPFVGLFIARISKGRTIREFVLGVLLIPSVFTLFWMTVFGNSAIDLIQNQGLTEFGEVVKQDPAVALFLFFQQFPFTTLLSIFAIIMIVIFFITSCDSGAMVLNMLCSYGESNTALWQRIYWSVAVGVVAIILLMIGGLNALQTMTIASALPFAITLLFAMAGLLNALRVETAKKESLQLNYGQQENQQTWQERLNIIVNYPNKETVQHYLNQKILPAFELIQIELAQKELTTQINIINQSYIQLTIEHGEEFDFIYAVRCRPEQQPGFIQSDIEPIAETEEDPLLYYRAEVHLREGGQNYNIMGWSQQAVINDIVDQYQKHLHFLHLLR